MTEDWDARTYDRIADPQTRWGVTVLDRLPLGGDETVLDAGCGTGRVTEHLLRRLPRGRVVALDASEAMLAEARQRLAPWGDRVDYARADRGRPLPLPAPVDAVLSTATFHWVPDHDALFANLAAVLRPGGSLVAQCGGHGNVARVLSASEDLGRSSSVAVTFPTAEATASRLRSSGFEDVWVWLHPEPTLFDSGEELEAYLASVVLRTFLDGMPAPERAEFIHAVAMRLPRPEVDYVRLNILARRARRAVADSKTAEKESVADL
jgi:trans-aconitate 2-methyltransferase